jgi:type VI secretion system protein ImpG
MIAVMANFDEHLLELYETELRYLRNAGHDFSTRYPKLAARLELGRNGSNDPQIERLLESFAFLTARLHQKADDDLAVVPGAILQSIYPSLASPVPGTAIASYVIDPENPPPPTGITVEPGTMLYARGESGELCRFKSAYEVGLLPINTTPFRVANANHYNSFSGLGLVAATAFTVVSSGAPLNLVEAPTLKFFLEGPRKHTTQILEMIMADAVEILLVDKATGTETPIGTNSISHVGFERKQALLPDTIETHPAQRLLREYFIIPEKFLFLELSNFDSRPMSQSVDVVFGLKSRPASWLDMRSVRPMLHCTPVINIFSTMAEPVALTHQETEYRVVPELGADDTHEVYSVSRVDVTSPNEPNPRRVASFFGQDKASKQGEAEIFWTSQRSLARSQRPGSDTFISFVEPNMKRIRPAREIANVSILCTNRTLTEQLTAGTELFSDVAVPASISLVDKPTPPIEAPNDASTISQLVSQLTLNNRSLSDDGNQKRHIEVLQELLSLHCPRHRPASMREVMGIVDVQTKTIVRRFGPNVWRGFCEGLQISLTLDESNFSESNAYLFASVLQNILSLHAAANSFVELILISKQREGVWKRWNPMIGGQALI